MIWEIVLQKYITTFRQFLVGAEAMETLEAEATN